MSNQTYLAWLVERGSPAVYLNGITGEWTADANQATKHPSRRIAELERKVSGAPTDRVCEHMFNCATT